MQITTISSTKEAEKNPAAAGAIRNHHLQRDRDWLQYFLEGDIRYIGLLGPRERREQMLAHVDPNDQVRVYGPIGLDIGADGHEQIALSILAEILAVHHGRPPSHLRDRKGRIHISEDGPPGPS